MVRKEKRKRRDGGRTSDMRNPGWNAVDEPALKPQGICMFNINPSSLQLSSRKFIEELNGCLEGKIQG